ncbi:hypothetical protein FN846DRAFT_771813 [Sphaerosporella brunnea]|uniref:Microbial-type PARG catalytic domain-containing protein n=1 Tax=Sphaerosporella brunnea TaxID=1250544 RepID=A0A5J5F8P1_9PEZI|nr:hypothetical protein FN846DRAFT_771813 [Sphaerosporella brunnea]
MPTNRQKAAAVAADTRARFSELPQKTGTDPTSYFYPSSSSLPILPEESRFSLRSAVIQGDPLDIAVDWQIYSFQQPSSGILVLNTANEKKPGGDWEGGLLGLGAEESLARRSNLVQTLLATDSVETGVTSYYPLPQMGGIYSPNCIVFRAGYEKEYALWHERDWTLVSVVSVAAVRRPKTDESGMWYSFKEEKDLQREKMKTILRIAAQNGHVNLVLGGFGSSLAATSSPYKNPIKDVSKLWQELLFECEEFQGYFQNVVFAVGGTEAGNEFRRYFG